MLNIRGFCAFFIRQNLHNKYKSRELCARATVISLAHVDRGDPVKARQHCSRQKNIKINNLRPNQLPGALKGIYTVPKGI